MSTQQDIYATGSENRPPMLNKDNYVPWSSHLLRYAKIKPNGKLIYNSIMNGPYVRRMIHEPGDPDREVPIAETFHKQTNDELTEKEVKQMEANDQAIQIILIGLPEDIYAVVDSCETAQEIWQIAQPGMNLGQDRQMQMVRGIANQNANQIGNGNVIAARAEGNANGNNGNQIKCYNYKGLGHFARNCTTKPRKRDVTFLQTQLLIAQKEEAGIQLQAEEFDFMAAAGDL
ncbi:gag-pol polyprotein [Tanacetum coccineum]|uniref:Gag-pol polyprotein n=1 Tax=Tanacetum coccineum TaxID=301880 RepID=A0ABQ5H5Z5_9ASTR